MASFMFSAVVGLVTTLITLLLRISAFLYVFELSSFVSSERTLNPLTSFSISPLLLCKLPNLETKSS